MSCFVRNMLVSSWQLPNFSAALASLSCFGPKNTLKFGETFDFLTRPRTWKRIFFATKHHHGMHWLYSFETAIIIYCLCLTKEQSHKSRLQINGNNRQKTVFIVFFSFYDEASWKEYSLLVFYLVSFSRSLFWFSFCLFQSTNKLEFLQSLFSWCLSNNPFWFLVRKQLKSNKHLQKGGKWYFLFGLQIWPIYVRRKTLLSITNHERKGTFWLVRGRCKFCNIPGTAKINGQQITFVKLRFKTLYKRKKQFAVKWSLFFQCGEFFFSNFHVTKVKELTPSSWKWNLYWTTARSGHIGKYYADQFSMLLSSTASSQYSSRTNNDNFFHNSAVKDFSFILSFL